MLLKIIDMNNKAVWINPFSLLVARISESELEAKLIFKRGAIIHISYSEWLRIIPQINDALIERNIR